MYSSCPRGSLVCILRKISSLKGLSIRTAYPGKFCTHQSWRYLNTCRCDAQWHGLQVDMADSGLQSDWMMLRVFPNPNSSVILCVAVSLLLIYIYISVLFLAQSSSLSAAWTYGSTLSFPSIVLFRSGTMLSRDIFVLTAEKNSNNGNLSKVKWYLTAQIAFSGFVDKDRKMDVV